MRASSTSKFETSNSTSRRHSFHSDTSDIVSTSGPGQKVVACRVSRGIGGCTKRPFFCSAPKKLKGRECHFWLKSGRAFIDLRPFSCQKWLSKFEIQVSRQAQGSFARQFLPASQAGCSPGIQNWRAKIPWPWREIWISNFDSYFWQENGIISKNVLPDFSQNSHSPSFGDFSFFWVILGAWSKMAAWRNPLSLY